MNKIIRKTTLILTFITMTSCNLFAKEEANSYGTEEEAKQMLERAIRIIDSNPTVAFTIMNVGQGGFHVKDLYPFCFDKKGVMVVHPTLAGTDMSNFVSSDGVKVAKVMLQKAKKNKLSKITYSLNRTISSSDGLPVVSKKESKKIAFYKKVGNYTCATGFHPS